MAKQCTKCNKVKPLDEFPLNKKWRDNRCKSCKVVYQRRLRSIKRNERKFWYVYYLPEEHYIGVSKGIKDRMHRHKKLGKITDNYEIIYKHEHPAACLMVEALFHFIGYNGCQYDRNYDKDTK